LQKHSFVIDVGRVPSI